MFGSPWPVPPALRWPAGAPSSILLTGIQRSCAFLVQDYQSLSTAPAAQPFSMSSLAASGYGE